MVCSQLRVMIVDDQQVVCDVLSDELHERGYLCDVAFDGNEALAKLRKHDFDLVLLDIKLPGMSGMEVLAKIRSNHSNTTTVMITAVNNVDTAVEAMKLGASDYIVKPFDLDKVDTSIRTALETKKWEKRDCEPARCVRGIEGNKQATGGFLKQMDAIARGVEIGYDLVTGYSIIVMYTTIRIARQFHIPEKQIQRWAAARAKLDSERNGVIKSTLNKLERSPLTQSIMGIAVPHLYKPNLKESQN